MLRISTIKASPSRPTMHSADLKPSVGMKQLRDNPQGRHHANNIRNTRHDTHDRCTDHMTRDTRKSCIPLFRNFLPISTLWTSVVDASSSSNQHGKENLNQKHTSGSDSVNRHLRALQTNPLVRLDSKLSNRQEGF